MNRSAVEEFIVRELAVLIADQFFENARRTDAVASSAVGLLASAVLSLEEGIFTEGDTWDELRKNVIEATSAFFFDRPRPERVRLRLVRDEVLLVA